MKAIIIYKGKYGATARYSEWLSQTLQIPFVRSEDIETEDLATFDCLILGSSVYLGKLQLKAWLKENSSLISRKSLHLFIVCAIPADEPDALQEIVRDNVPEEVSSHSEIYFLPGRVILQSLSLTDKLLLRLGALAARNPAEKQRMLKGFDAMNAASLNPIIKAVNAELSHKQYRLLEGKTLK